MRDEPGTNGVGFSGPLFVFFENKQELSIIRFFVREGFCNWSSIKNHNYMTDKNYNISGVRHKFSV